MNKYWILHHATLLMIVALLTLLFTSCSPPVATLALEQAAISTSNTWTAYMLGNARSDFNPSETTINPTTVSQLKLHWVDPGNSRVFSQPVVANGLIYWGTGDGFEHATDLNGHQVWMDNLGTSQTLCSNDPTSRNGVLDTATVAPVMLGGKSTLVLFVGGGDGTFYALNALTGAIIWKRLLGAPPAHFLWSSPTLYNGKVYEGVSSLDDCPLVQGKLVQMDARTGVITHTFNTVPNRCLGGSIWSSPTIDTAAGTIYISTGNPGTCGTTELYAPALIKLRASDLSFLDAWQVPAKKQIDDSDFGATPTLFDATIAGVKKQMVGAVNKNGIYYAFDRAAIGHGPVWIAHAGGANTVAPSAWDGTYLYLGGQQTKLNGKVCASKFQALDPATGASLWRRCLSFGAIYGAITVVPGVAFVSDGNALLAIATATGKTLFRYSARNADFLGPASVCNGVLYIGSYTGGLYAFGLQRSP
jgi:outer membrane protein assembly factor BamB